MLRKEIKIPERVVDIRICAKCGQPWIAHNTACNNCGSKESKWGPFESKSNKSLPIRNEKKA